VWDAIRAEVREVRGPHCLQLPDSPVFKRGKREGGCDTQDGAEGRWVVDERSVVCINEILGYHDQL
jgi:hypothetical protein